MSSVTYTTLQQGRNRASTLAGPTRSSRQASQSKWSPAAAPESSRKGLRPQLTSSQASSSPTLGPSLSLRFGCCATQNATPTPQEKPQGKPLLRLRSDSTPGPEIQVKRTRSHKRDFAATQSPGVFDDAEERYWSRRGAIDRSKSSASPLNSPIEKPQRNHNSWLVPGRIAFLPQVRKGSILADQVLPKFQAQLAKHPVVVMSTPNSRGVVAIAILTSLGGQTVQEKYARMYAENPDRARMFGGDYLLIKHRSTPLHDNTPLLRLKDGKEMARRTYVSAAYGNFYVQAEDLAPYRENGFGKDSELFLDETSFKDLVRYRDSRIINQVSIDEVKWPTGCQRPADLIGLGTRSALSRIPISALN
ncbi:uncharacterized protein BKA78DRAFT_300424 [Phyllosticta capitalensis]|uniref:uncharacterized protein n=1 Tax=Phyllosticta capitalensis TaxID=121624 RepID=UPI00312EF2A6